MVLGGVGRCFIWHIDLGLLLVVSSRERFRLLLKEVLFPWAISSFMVGVDKVVSKVVKGMRSFWPLWVM